MRIYLSCGASTLVALMTADREATEQPAVAFAERGNHVIGSIVDERSTPEGMSEMEADSSQIARRCERAVVSAYRDLRAHGTGDLPAFQACTTLYRIHHPEASLNEARRLVAEWIDHHVVRGDAGPTPGCDCG